MVLKRLLDLVIASLLLLLLALPLALVAILIKLDSPGPVLYSQERIGHLGRRFRMYKLRTMVVEAERLREDLQRYNEASPPLFKIRHDPRCTRIGRLLRRWSIDELPQLVNVLRGEMSLVGPRPALLQEAAQYDQQHALRVLAMPGMTGLWQVNGRSVLPFERMVELDLHYARNWSIWLDMLILLKTVPAILSGKGAY
jgi:lipopolysaccharide/colanic/teichoic acid biosynthesis glycosyltransferase